MKFKKTTILLFIFLSILKLSTSQLFEQFNEEPSNLEKSSKSLFDSSDDTLKPISNEANSNNNKGSIFGDIQDDIAKPTSTANKNQFPIENPQPEIITNINGINNNSIFENDANKNIKSSSSIKKFINKLPNKLQSFNLQKAEIKNDNNEKDEIKIRQEKLEKIKSKNSEKIRLQKQEIKHLEAKFDEISHKTNNFMKIMKSNSSLEKIKGKYRNNLELIEGYAKDYKNLSNNINKLEKNVESISSELDAIENKKDLRYIKDTKKVDISRKLIVNGNLNTKNLLTEELRLGENKISNNFIQLDKDFKIVYKNQVTIYRMLFRSYSFFSYLFKYLYYFIGFTTFSINKFQ